MKRISLLILFMFVGSSGFAAEDGGPGVLPERLREVSGRVHCPGLPKLGNGFDAEGYLFGNAKEQFVLTTSRALISDDGNPREPLRRCTFTSHGSDRRPLFLSAEMIPSNFGFGGFDNVKHPENNFVLARLNGTLAVREPLRFEAYPTELGILDETLLFALTFDGKDLVLKNCAVTGVSTGTRKRPEVGTHTCVLPTGETNGLALARRNGQLIPVGLISSSTLILGLSDRVLDLAQRVMGVSF